MKTAAQWRRAYFLAGQPVEPGSMLGDVLLDFEALEDDNRLLTARLASPDALEDEIDALEREIAQLEEENTRLERQCQGRTQTPTAT